MLQSEIYTRALHKELPAQTRLFVQRIDKENDSYAHHPLQQVRLGFMQDLARRDEIASNLKYDFLVEV